MLEQDVITAAIKELRFVTELMMIIYIPKNQTLDQN